MGLLSRLKPKEERLYKNPETGETRWVPVEKNDRHVIRELTYEEQFKPRVHPWQTERGKRVIKSIGSGVKRVDQAVVNYNRNRNPAGRSAPSRPAIRYSTRDNYNPFGSMFDTGMNYNHPRKKSSSKTKYTVIKGKAYPIVGSKKKSKKKSSSNRRRNDWDVFNAFGGYKL